MSEYYITKREPCHCVRAGFRDDSDAPLRSCVWCDGLGIVEKQVDADEWLEERLQARSAEQR